MTTSCPKCGTALEIIIDTNYEKAQSIIGKKLSASDLTNDALAALNWKQSQKRAALSTLLVSSELLEVPIAKLLHERLNTSANLTWKLGEVTYKLSRTDTAAWIQRWKPVSVAQQ